MFYRFSKVRGDCRYEDAVAYSNRASLFVYSHAVRTHAFDACVTFVAACAEGEPAVSFSSMYVAITVYGRVCMVGQGFQAYRSALRVVVRRLTRPASGIGAVQNAERLRGETQA